MLFLFLVLLNNIYIVVMAQIYTGGMLNGFVKGYYFYWQPSPNHSHFASVNLSPEFPLKRDALEYGVTSQTFLSTLFHFPFSHLLK